LLSVERGRYLTRMPFLAGNWTQHRDFRTPARRSFLSQWNDSQRGNRR
jgi:hypothetical protein